MLVLCEVNQCKAPVHYWWNIWHQKLTGLRASPRVLCLVSRRGRLPASHSSVQPPLSQTASHAMEIQSDCEQRWAATRGWYSSECSALQCSRTSSYMGWSHTDSLQRRVNAVSHWVSATGSQPLSPEPSAWWRSSAELSSVKDTLCFTLRHDMSAVLNTKWDVFWKNTLYEYH